MCLFAVHAAVAAPCLPCTQYERCFPGDLARFHWIMAMVMVVVVVVML